jgi:hypothetical protein
MKVSVFRFQEFVIRNAVYGNDRSEKIGKK